MNTVYCPVIEGQIDGTGCLEIVSVTDRFAKPTLIEDIVPNWDDIKKEKCLNCPYHDDLE